MTNSKTSTVFNIISNGTRLYIQNLFILTTPVVAPVLGLFLGIFLMILPMYFLPQNYPSWAENLPILNELYMLLIIILISIAPGFIVFKMAFWNYMLKIVSLNSMVGDILKKKVIKHHTQYTKVIALRTKDYLLMLGIWLLMILMGLALPISLFLFDIEQTLLPYLLCGFEFLAGFLLIILSIYLSLSFQVFAFETSFGPMQTLEESFKLVLNNFWRIVLLLLVLTIITNLLIPQLFVFLADALMLKNTIAIPFQIMLENVFNSYDHLYTTMSQWPIFAFDSQNKFVLETSKMFSITIISSIISLLMLPLGSCFYTLFYFDAKKRIAPKVEKVEEEPKKKTKTKKSKKK